MTRPVSHSEAVAEAAFNRFAAASARLHRSGRIADAVTARREWARFAKAYLTPAELDGIDPSTIPALRDRT